MSRDATRGEEGSISPYGEGTKAGVRTFWLLLVGLAGAIVSICVGFAVFYKGKAFRKINHLHASPELVAIVIVAIGIGCLSVARSLEPPLDGTSDSSLLISYRKRFFLWVAMGETPFFIGIAAVVATGWYWPFLVGAGFAALGYLRIAPTAGALARDQEKLNEKGSSRSLVAALATLPTTAKRFR
jgi:hypothetical protein